MNCPLTQELHFYKFNISSPYAGVLLRLENGKLGYNSLIGEEDNFYIHVKLGTPGTAGFHTVNSTYFNLTTSVNCRSHTDPESQYSFGLSLIHI